MVYPCLISELRRVYNDLYTKNVVADKKSDNNITKIIFYKNENNLVSIDKRKFKMYIVFIPWKHQLKELREVDEKYIINPQSFNADETWITKDKFTSETYDGYIYPSSLEVKDFVGYKFIYDNNSFIANLCLHEFEDCLTILYKNMPEVLDIELGNIEE